MGLGEVGSVMKCRSLDIGLKVEMKASRHFSTSQRPLSPFLYFHPSLVWDKNKTKQQGHQLNVYVGLDC